MTSSPNTGITGIHHATAVSGNAQRTVDFYTQLLGLRLIEQSIDLNDLTSYRLIFSAEDRRSGTVNFLERKHAPRGHYGIGGTHHLAFETRNKETLRQWKRWLADRGLAVTGPYDRVYFESIYFTDPDGLILEIATRGPGWTLDEAPDALGSSVKLPPAATIIGGRDEAVIAADTWPKPIPEPSPAMRLARLHHITAIGSDAAQTERFFTDILGMRTVKRTVNFDNPTSPHLYFGVADGEPGTIVTYFAYPHGTMRPVQLGTGMTHHFALGVADDASLAHLRDDLITRGVETTDVQNHGTLRSISLQDPDGHLIEIATCSPGHTRDESPTTLGQTLSLPPSLESRRDEIARNLTPLIVPDPFDR